MTKAAYRVELRKIHNQLKALLPVADALHYGNTHRRAMAAIDDARIDTLV